MNPLDPILLGRHFLQRERVCVSSDLPSSDSDGDTSIYARSNVLRELDLRIASLAAREKQRAISNIDHGQ